MHRFVDQEPIAENRNLNFPIISSNDLEFYLLGLPEQVFVNPKKWDGRSHQEIKCVQMPSRGIFMLQDDHLGDPSKTQTQIENNIRSTLYSMSGREITTLYTDLLRDHFSHNLPDLFKSVKSPISSRTDISDEESQIFQKACGKVTTEKKFLLKDMPQVAFDIWKNLKTFYYFDPRQEVDQDWFAWNFHLNREQLAHEEAVIGIHSLRVKQFLEQDLFEPQSVFLPLETNPTYKLTAQEPYRYQVYYNGFGIQHIGQSDWLLRFKTNNQDKKIIIQQSYVPTEDLSTVANRLKILIHSIGVKKTGGNWSNIQLNPGGVVYLLQVYDFDTASYHYTDLSIQPEEFPTLLDELENASLEWIKSNDLYKSEMKRRKQEVVYPKLRLPATV